MHKQGTSFLFGIPVGEMEKMIMHVKNTRKNRSLQRRQEWLNRLNQVFKNSYSQSVGTPQERLEAACRAADAVILEAMNKNPNQRSFFALVVEDFQKYLISLTEPTNPSIEQIKEKVDPIPGEVGTVNV